MKLKDFTVEDFVLNKKFRKWVLEPDRESNLYWENYLEKYPQQLEKIEKARMLISRLPKITHQLSHDEVHEMWRRIESGMVQKQEKKTEVVPLNPTAIIKKNLVRQKWWRQYNRLGRYAASLIFLLAAAFTWYQIDQIPLAEEKKESFTVLKETHWGQKLTIFLNDGSEVILNSGSSIEYLQNFSENERLVNLQGEAFFKVAEDSSRPFRVNVNGVITEALGTSFNINAYQEDEFVNIGLVEGKVSVSKENSPEIILAPGESAVLDQVNDIFIKSSLDQKFLDWRNGILYFKDANLEQVFKKLSRWYGVEFKFLNQSKKIWQYNAEYKNLDMINVLDDIAFAMEFSYSFDNETVSVVFK